VRLAGAASLNATLHWSQGLLDTEGARVDAMAAPGPLAAMPIALKDNIVTIEQPTTCGSRILEGYLSPYTATAVNRLRQAGALIAAKTNMDEFAMGSSTEHSAYGRVKHPLDPDRVPGGSSGGSAALVAAGVVPVALGSETGGSVRQPASFCGVVGMKPSYGRVSRYGLVAFGSSLDCISVFSRTVADAGRVLSVMSGPDPLDSTTLDQPPMAVPAPRADLRGLRVGLPREYFPADLDAGVAAALRRTREAVQDLGAEIHEVSLPHSPYAVPTYYIVAPAEAAANLARYDGVRYGPRRNGSAGDIRSLYQATRGQGFGAEVQRRILVGTYVLSAGYYDAYYGKAQQVRALIAEDFRRVFASGVDLLLTPTTPTPAFRAGEKTGDPVSMYLADIFVSAISLAGLPAVSLPVGRSEGLPVGAQLIAPFFEDERLLSAAAAIERAIEADAEVSR
jgi:aspartyl-tRNA(Asn)/glutamyl-tRNA(Gln) amidotransferase subunit A